MTSKIRDPKQKRAIEKKERIIKKGFTLICEKGYHHVNTDDIAAYAEVSTGTIYNYFLDKRDIFMQGIEYYAATVLFPLKNELPLFSFTMTDLESAITTIVTNCIKAHENSKKEHEEIMSMSHSDEELATWIQDEELLLAEEIAGVIAKKHPDIKNLHEKVHIIIGMIENACHEVVYHQHLTLNFESIKTETIKAIVYILT